MLRRLLYAIKTILRTSVRGIATEMRSRPSRNGAAPHQQGTAQFGVSVRGHGSDEVGDEQPGDLAPSAGLVPVDDAGVGEGVGLASVPQLAAAGREQVAQPI